MHMRMGHPACGLGRPALLGTAPPHVVMHMGLSYTCYGRGDENGRPPTSICVYYLKSMTPQGNPLWFMAAAPVSR